MWQTRAPPPRMAAHTAHTFVVHRDGCDWDAAAELLERDGFVVLSAAPDEPPLIPVSLCVDARDAACVYLEELLCGVERRGVQRSDEFRFAEVVHRDGLRYDLPIRWCDRNEQDAENNENKLDSAFARTAITHEVDSAFATLHAITHELARNVLAAVVERRDDKRLPGVTAPPIAGCVTSVPSASAQDWHSDGSEEGVYNFFVPLVSLQPSNGPTELRPGTHHTGVATGRVAPRVAPLLAVGEVLVFDYRCRHRGLGNSGGHERPVAYVTYTIGAARDENFPAAATLAWD